MSKQFVHIKNGALYDIENQPILLEGVGLNAWLLPEGYMFKSYKGIDRPRKFYAWTETLLGKEASDLFWIQFRELFITENDIKLIKNLGFNSVRIPFDYEILFHASETKEKLIIKEEGFNLIDRVLKWCEKYQVYAILDLHAAPGGQTGANIDNCKHDQPELFTNELYQKQTINLWHDIALRYQDNVWVAAYDLMNEPLPEWFSKYNDMVMPLYQKIIKAIRTVDQHHLISIEGVHWSTDFQIFDKKPDEGIFPQFHKYWSPFDMESILKYIKLAQKWDVPLFMGEGGEHHLLWYSGAFKMYRQLGISWNFWSYKKMATDNSILSFKEPDLWQKCLALDEEITQQDALKVFDELLENIKVESCELLQKVTNHLFQKDEFETFGIGFDYDPLMLDHISLDNIKVFRSSEGVTCVDADGNEMIPDFSINKRPDGNTVFPYLDAIVGSSYDYSFNISKDGDVTITIYGTNLNGLAVSVDNIQIKSISIKDNALMYSCNLDQGKHKLNIAIKQSARIKKISIS